MVHEKNSRGQIIGQIMLSFLPLLCYGIYKNGFLLYQKNLIPFYNIFNGLYLILISLGIYFLGNLIFKRKIIPDYDIIYFYLIAFLIKPFPNLIIYSISLGILFILFLILNKLKFNKLAVMKLVLMSIFYFSNDYSYANVLEQNTAYAFSYFDLLMGRCIGGFATTSIILSLVTLAILIYQKNIKKEIAFSSLLTYFIFNSIYLGITRQFSFLNFFNANIIFALLFVAPDAQSSPNKLKKKYLYGVSIGLMSVIFSILINNYAGTYIAIILASLGLNWPQKKD